MLIQCWMPGGVWDEEPKVIDRGNQNQAPATPVLETHLGIFEIDLTWSDEKSDRLVC